MIIFILNSLNWFFNQSIFLYQINTPSIFKFLETNLEKQLHMEKKKKQFLNIV